MNSLTIFNAEEFDVMQRFAKAMVTSGYFTDAKDIAQAFVKIQAGKELGIPPFAAMTGIYVIQGKPALGANVLATLIKNDPRYNYRVLEMTSDICRIQFFENGEPCGVSEFTIAEARKAGTKNLDKFPKNMLFARAISNGAKWYCPGIFGGAPVYTPDELGADVDEDGNVVEGTVVYSNGNGNGNGHADDNEPINTSADWSMDFLSHCAANINRYSGNPHKAKQALMKHFDNPPVTKADAKKQFEWLKEHAAQRDTEEVQAAQQGGLFEDESPSIEDGEIDAVWPAGRAN